MQGSKTARVAAVSVGLIFAGSALGCVIGVGLLGVFALVIDGPGGFPYAWEAFALAGGIGALLGGLIGPVIAWAALRDIPLWRVFGHTGVAAVIGGATGFLASGLNPFVAVGCATVGLIAGALRLRARTRPAPRGLPPVA